MLQLPRCLVRICNLFHKNNQIANGTVFINAIAAGITILKNKFASQMWAARPHLGSIFEKLLHRKTFCLPAAWILHPISILFLCHVMFHVKHCFQGNHPNPVRQGWGTSPACLGIAIAILPVLSSIFVAVPRQFYLLRKCGLLAHTSAAFLKNCCTEKLSVACGSLLAISMEKLSDSCRVSCETWRELLLEIPTKFGSARLGHIPSLPGNRNCP